MRVFDESFKCHSVICIEDVKYALDTVDILHGGGLLFTVEEQDKPRDQIHFTKEQAKAFFHLITTNGSK
jgi:hypothetical protein